MSNAWFHPLVAASLLMACFAGCETSTGKVTAEGTVSYNNQPLTGGRLVLYNAKNEQVGGANINPDGTFIATDLPREDLKVTVITTGNSVMDKMQSAPPTSTVIETPGSGGVPVPEKYQKPETTDLTLNPTSGGKVELKLQ